jgi:hypothetical protein
MLWHILTELGFPGSLSPDFSLRGMAALCTSGFSPKLFPVLSQFPVNLITIFGYTFDYFYELLSF